LLRRTRCSRQIAAGAIATRREFGLTIHDYGASVLVIEEAGGIVTDFHGRPIRPRGGILGAAPDLHAWLLEGFKD